MWSNVIFAIFSFHNLQKTFFELWRFWYPTNNYNKSEIKKIKKIYQKYT